MKKALFGLIVLAGLAFLGWRIYDRVRASSGPAGGPGRGRGAPVVAVEVAPVRTDAVKNVGRFTGSLYPVSQFVVAPKIAGRLERLTVNVGDRVTPGLLIAELDDDEYVQQVEQARAELAVSEASVAEFRSALDLSEREIERVTALHEKKMIPDKDFDEATMRCAGSRAKVNVALAAVDLKRAVLKTAEVRLSYTRIKASWEGDDPEPRVVGERFVDVGEMLRANDPIVSILDQRMMLAYIDVIERDYPRIILGQRALILTDGYPGRVFTGTIVRIAPLLKETSRQARVELEVPNSDLVLKPGMFIRAEIEFARHEGATVVPVAALAARDGKQGVFLVVEIDAETGVGKARFTAVTPGIVDGDLAEIVSPPLSGSVVTMGHHLLEDGAAIRLPGAATPGGGRRDQGAGGGRGGDAGGPPGGGGRRPGGGPRGER